MSAFASNNDSNGALAWLSALTAGGDPSGRYSAGIVNYFTLGNFAPIPGREAQDLALLATIVSDTDKERATAAFVRKRQASAPALALEAVVRFYPEQKKAAAAQDNLRAWAARDPAAARAFVATSNSIPEALRASLQSALGP